MVDHKVVGGKMVKNPKRVVAGAACAALIIAGLGIGAAHAASGNPADATAASRAMVSPPPSALPSVTLEPRVEPSASSMTPAPLANGSSGDLDGIPYYDVNSDTSLIQYPANEAADVVENARLWVEMNALTAQCMDLRGYPYRYILWWDRPAPTDSRADALTKAQEQYGTPEFEALYGDPYAPEYNPQEGGGCDGEAKAQMGDISQLHEN